MAKWLNQRGAQAREVQVQTARVMQHIFISVPNRMLRSMDMRDRFWSASAWSVLAIGLLFRIVHYLSNRSIWLDEAMLARNILDRGPLDLLQPLSYNQTESVLVRLLIDAATILFGPNELALRLVPLLASLASLFLCFLIGQHFLDKRFLVVFMSIFSFSYPLVYYAQEVKPYAIDVAVALALIYAFLRLMTRDRVTKAHLAVLGVSGSIAIGLSHTAVFVLSGIGISLLVMISTKDRRFLRDLFSIFVLWVLTFSIYYMLFMRPVQSSTFLQDFWKDGFMPVPTSVDAIKVWGFTLQSLLYYIGYPLPWTIFVTALIAVSVADAMRNRRLDSLIFVLVIIVTLVASTLHQYPLVASRTSKWQASYGRLILFLVPLLYLLIVRGLQLLAGHGRPYIAWLLTALLLVLSLSSALSLFNPILREEVRPVSHYLSEHQKPNDQIYIYYRGHHAVKYYQWYNKLPAKQNIHWGKYSIRDLPPFLEEIESMKQWPRVWFLFSHRYAVEEVQFLSHIDGELLDQYYAPGVSLFLYRFESGHGATSARK